MDMPTALRALGVDESLFSKEERERFENDGYVCLGTLLTREETYSIIARLEEILAEEGDNAGNDGFREDGTASLGALVNKSPLFDVLYLHPRLLAAVGQIMGDDFGLSSLTSRAALPGAGHQALHWDSSEPRSVNALWVLTEFTAENGPTRVIPGSHVFGVKPDALLDDPHKPHPDEIKLIAPAGTLFLLNARVWHSGTRNGSSRLRHMASAFFMRRGRYQSGNVDRRLRPATVARLSPAALYILDHDMP